MKELTVAIQDEYEGKVIYKTELYTEEEYKKLEEENETLKDNVEFLHSCLDDRDKSIELLEEKKKPDYGACWLWLFFIIIYSLLVAVLIKVLPRE